MLKVTVRAKYIGGAERGLESASPSPVLAAMASSKCHSITRFSVGDGGELNSKLTVFVTSPGVKSRTNTDGSVEVDVKQNEDGTIDPVRIRVEQTVTDTGKVPLKGLIFPEAMPISE